jgi:uncharacterized protein YcfJ
MWWNVDIWERQELCLFHGVSQPGLNQEKHMLNRTFFAIGTFAMLATTQVVPSQAASRQQCEDYAYRAAYRKGPRTGDVLTGTATGAVAGGALGAILGKGRGRNIGKGALIGGVAGTVLGATSGRAGSIDRRVYDRAYADCIDASPIYRRSNRVSDDEQYCMDKYRSYNPDTGTYLTYAGEYRQCP